MSSTTICLFDNGAAYEANDGGNAMSDRGLARRGPRRPHARVPSRQQERKHRRGSLDIGVLMGGTLAVKSVRHAFSVLEQLKAKGR